MRVYQTKDGDVLDAICWHTYGTTLGTVEVVLQANRQIADSDAVFNAGITITLPDITVPKEENIITLWQ